MKIRGCTALVTGANRGLGRALVAELLARGATRVYATARDESTFPRLGERVTPLRLDVRNAQEIAHVASVTKDVDLLINNAGVLASMAVLSARREDIERDFATNFFGTLEVTKALAPTLERTRGAVVNVLTVASLASAPGLGGYSASKAAAWSLTQALRADLGKRGVTVHAAFPGPIDTDMVKGFPIAKTSPVDVARAMLEGLEAGADDIATDAMSRSLLEAFRARPKDVERQLAAL